MNFAHAQSVGRVCASGRKVGARMNRIRGREGGRCYRGCAVSVCCFFQAEDGIRDLTVTGVQTCALPICILQVDIQRKKPSFTLKEQVINEVVAGQFFLRAARIDATANKLKDVTIYNLADPERRRVITADSGLMAYTPGGRDLYLTLQDGDIREVNRSDPTQFNRTFFITNRMRVAGVGNSLERTTNDAYKSDREMTICEMRQAAAEARREAGNAALEGRRVIENDLRRLAGLAPRTLSPGMFATDTSPPGLYCRPLRRIPAWVSPPPARPPPHPPSHPPAP